MSIDGTWFAAEAPLTFLFQQQDDAVTGTFHDEKTFTCELKGRIAGNRVSFSFETAWSWLNVHEIGSATLDIASGGTVLSGPVLTGGKPGRWTLTRTRPEARPPPVASPEPTRWKWPGGFRGGGGGGGGSGPAVPYHDRIRKDVWDAERDPALLERLRRRAEVEEELRVMLEQRKLIAPRKGN